MQFRKPPTSQPSIDIAPLVDVVFLLVIFFAVTTTFLETSGLALELPKSSSTATRELEVLTVYLDAEGALALDETPVADMTDLTAQLREALEDREDKGVVLRADTTVDHGSVVELMDAIRSAGATGLTVAARAAEE